MTMLVATPVPMPFGTIEEFLIEDEAFYKATGWDALGLLSAMGRGECKPSPKVQEWAMSLNAWDCWLFVEAPAQGYLDIEALEDEMDMPAQPNTRGGRRPQAARSARARRATFLGRLAYR